MKKFRLKALRKAKRITQQKLGIELNLEQSTISEYENQIRIPHICIMEKFCDYFDVSMDYIIGRSDLKNYINLKLSSDEINHIHKYRKLNIIMKEKLNGYIDGLLDLF